MEQQKLPQEAELAWRAFETSGKVSDYLRYTAASRTYAGDMPPKAEGREREDAAKGAGDYPQAAEYR